MKMLDNLIELIDVLFFQLGQQMITRDEYTTRLKEAIDAYTKELDALKDKVEHVDESIDMSPLEHGDLIIDENHPEHNVSFITLDHPISFEN